MFLVIVFICTAVFLLDRTLGDFLPITITRFVIPSGGINLAVFFIASFQGTLKNTFVVQL